MHCQEVDSNVSIDFTEQRTRGRAEHKGLWNQPPPTASSVPPDIIHFPAAAITIPCIYSVLHRAFTDFLSYLLNKALATSLCFLTLLRTRAVYR